MLNKVMRFLKWVWSLILAVARYFTHGIYLKHAFRLIGFTNKDYTTFEAISFSKRRSNMVWFGNNLLFPLFIIFLPWGFTLLRRYFQSPVPYDRSLLEIAISGSLTLVGFNVLRSASTYITEKLDDTKLREDLREQWPEVQEEIKGMKSKFRMWVHLFSFVCTILYVIQVVQLVNTTTPAVYYFLSFSVLITIISITMGRFIYLLETNFLDDHQVVELLFKRLRTQTADYNKFEEMLSKKGLL